MGTTNAVVRGRGEDKATRAKIRETAKPASAASSRTSTHTPLTVLWLDADDTFLRFACKSLRRSGYAAKAASSIPDAIRELSSAPIQVIVMDPHVRDAAEAIRFTEGLRVSNPGLQTILCSKTARAIVRSHPLLFDNWFEKGRERIPALITFLAAMTHAQQNEDLELAR